MEGRSTAPVSVTVFTGDMPRVCSIFVWWQETLSQKLKKKKKKKKRRKEGGTNEQRKMTTVSAGLYMLGPGRGTIRRCILVGVGVALLEEACHCGGGL